MTNILYVTSSSRGNASYSNQIAAGVLADLQRAHPHATVTVRDLAANPLPHIDGDFVTATRDPAGPQTERQRDLLAISDTLVDELFAADVIVIAAPMINFSVSSNLKAWIDFVARAGRTFSYSEAGPKGLVTGKRVILITATGGVYAGDAAAMDFQLPWLKGVLAFLGLTDVEVVQVAGTAFGPDAARKAVEAAAQRAQDVVGRVAPARVAA
jgi:FMN-dependent NADH-azoreductase